MNSNMVILWDRNQGHLSNCRSLVQQIIWLIDNWENTMRPFHVTKREEEIIQCENALLKVKELMWSSCLNMHSKYVSQTKERRGEQGALMAVQPEVTEARAVTSNAEVMVRGSNGIPVAVHQRESTHTVVSPHHQIVKNLLLDWSVFINPHFQLCVAGTLPNDGKWETSPIMTRLSPMSVKTVSGTVYTIHGRMVIDDDSDVPDFVQKKFQDGFPEDWRNVASKWISVVKRENYGQSGPKNPDGIEGMRNSEPRVLLNDIAKKTNSTQVSLQKNKFAAPLAKAIPRNQASQSTPRGSPLLRPPMSKQFQDESSDEEERRERNEVQRNERSPVLPRFSKRLLSKSLLDMSMRNEKDDSRNKNVTEEKFKYIKNWTVEVDTKQDKLVLYGTLISEKGQILNDCHRSRPIANRVHADIVETENGDHYRLVGPSSSRSKAFDFGFPLHWEALVETLKASEPVRRGRKHLLAKSAAGLQRTRGSPQTNAALVEVKRHTSMINRTLKHHLSKAQSSMVEAMKNGSLSKRANAGKESLSSVSTISRNEVPSKRRKISDEDPSEGIANARSDSMANVSESEKQWKQEVIKKMQNIEKAKAAVRNSATVEQDKGKEGEPEVRHEKTSAKPVRSVKPVRKSQDKYALGLATDDCLSENDFNIF